MESIWDVINRIVENDFAISSLIGISSGISASLLFSFLKYLFSKINELIYEIPKVDGSWHLYDTNDSKNNSGTAKIKQIRTKIRAKVHRTRTRNGKTTSRNFVYKGKVVGGQLLLNFREKAGGKLISGCLVLKISSNLNTLQGYTVYLNIDSSQVEAHPIRFEKSFS